LVLLRLVIVFKTLEDEEEDEVEEDVAVAVETGAAVTDNDADENKEDDDEEDEDGIPTLVVTNVGCGILVNTTFLPIKTG